VSNLLIELVVVKICLKIKPQKLIINFSVSQVLMGVNELWLVFPLLLLIII